MGKLERFLTLQRKPGLIHDGFKYRRDSRRTDGRVVWRCLGRSCSASIKTNSEESEVVSMDGTHNHTPVRLNQSNKSSSEIADVSTSQLSESSKEVPSLTSLTNFPLLEAGILSKSPINLVESVLDLSDINVTGRTDVNETGEESIGLNKKSVAVSTPVSQRRRSVSNQVSELNKTQRDIEPQNERDNLITHSMNLQVELDACSNNRNCEINFLKSRIVELENVLKEKSGLSEENETLKLKLTQMITTIEVLESDNALLSAKNKALEIEVVDLRNFYSPGDTMVDTSLNLGEIRLQNSFNTLQLITHSSKFEKDNERVVKNNGIKKTTKRSLKPRNKKSNRKVLVLSDSHGRDIGWDLNREVGGDGFEVTVVSRPGCSFNTVTHDISDFTKNFTHDDTVIVLAGTNDVVDGAVQPAKLDFKPIIETANRARVVVSTIPFRYDKPLMNLNVSKLNKRAQQQVPPPPPPQTPPQQPPPQTPPQQPPSLPPPAAERPLIGALKEFLLLGPPPRAGAQAANWQDGVEEAARLAPLGNKGRLQHLAALAAPLPGAPGAEELDKPMPPLDLPLEAHPTEQGEREPT
ncbi:hypothetical protein LSTR_LSTR010502 [Laodelphax striatellus]|uniref:FLYWCH-type domain-containing protein n=1 Tax=Laodelphax striatellus TaxID=195883 RepID=A0A482WSE5_LAOST|nr:hypothetical protein LSTR_LSTR010502 [Laodelphax striatellus]